MGIPIQQTEDGSIHDIEDVASNKRPRSSPNIPISTKRRKLGGKRKQDSEFSDDELSKHWRDVLGEPPQLRSNKVGAFSH